MVRTLTILIFFCFPVLAQAQVWDSLESGVNAPVYALHLESSTNQLWVGGAFTTADQQNLPYLAKWNNNSWSSVGTPDDTVLAVLEVDDVPYLGGAFSQMEGQAANGFAQRQGSNWAPIGNPLDGGTVRALQSYNNGIVVAGDFTQVGGQNVNHIAFWDGSIWTPLGQGLNGPVKALAALNGNLYAAGDFTAASGVAVEGLARWNGVQWEAVPGTNFGNQGGSIHDLEVWYGRLYAGGCFDTIDNQAAHNIALFDGQGWFPLSAGTDDCVFALEGLTELYVGGDFSTVDSTMPAGRLAKWDGGQWTAGEGDFNGPIFTMEGNASQLYVAGDFSAVTSDRGTLPVNHITRLDFTTGIDRIPAASGLRLFPNPATTQVTLATPPTLTQFTILLTDLSGRLMSTHFIQQPGTTTLSVAHLPNGVYLIHLMEDNVRQASGRLVVAR